MIRLQVIEGPNTCDQIALHSVQTKLACIIATWKLGLQGTSEAHKKTTNNVIKAKLSFSYIQLVPGFCIWFQVP